MLADTGDGEAAKTVGPRDLREWLALIEADGGLKRVTAEVDAIEELAAITYMVARDEDAPALMFENIRGNDSGVRVLSNMLGASRRRFALAVGLDPDLSTRDLIAAMRERGIRIATWGEPDFEDFIRVSIGLPEDTEAFLAALGEILNGAG